MFVAQETFGAGQISDRSLGRATSQQVKSGCLKLTNAIISRFGSAAKRGGTRYVGETLNGAAAFFVTFSTAGFDFLVEITSTKVRVWDATTETVVAGPFTIPHTGGDIFEIQHAVSTDSLYLAHEDHPVTKLTRDLTGTFTLEELELSLPFLTTNTKTAQLRTPIDPLTSTFPVYSGPLGQEESYFTADDVNSYYRFVSGWFRVTARVSAFEVTAERWDAPPPFSTTSNNWVGPFSYDATIDTSGVQFVTTSSYNGGDLLELEARTSASGGVTPIPDYFQPEWMGSLIDINAGLAEHRYVFHMYDIRGDGSRCAVQCVRVFGGGGGAAVFPVNAKFYLPDLRTGPNEIIQAGDTTGNPEDVYSNAALFGPRISVGDRVGFVGGVILITEIVDTHHARGEILDPFDARYSTDIFNIGVGATSGYPRAVGFHQNRLFLGGVRTSPSTIFGSKTGNHTNFSTGANDDDAVTFTFTGGHGDLIQWIRSAVDVSQQGATILAVGTDDSEYVLRGFPVTPTDVGVDRLSRYGSRHVTPLASGPSLLFVERAGQNIRDMRFHRDVETFNDVSQLADGIFKDSPIRQMTFVREPFAMVFVVREDGKTYALSFRQFEGVIGWSPWDLTVTTATSVSGASEDKLWVCVLRNGSHRIEIWDDERYFDSWSLATSSGGLVTGLSRFNGGTVYVRDTKATHGPLAVSGGVADAGVQLFPPVYVGSPIQFELQPILHDEPDPTGDSLGRAKNWQNLYVQLRNGSGAGRVNEDNLSELTDNWRAIHGLSEYGVYPDVVIISDDAEPFEVLAVNAEYQIGQL